MGHDMAIGWVRKAGTKEMRVVTLVTVVHHQWTLLRLTSHNMLTSLNHNSRSLPCFQLRKLLPAEPALHDYRKEEN
jgi:hypothetical protein